MDLGLSGKKAVVLASSRGLGRASAEALASEGCEVAICSRNGEEVGRTAEEIAQRHQVSVHGRECDVSDPHSLGRFLDWAVGALGDLHVLVNNCGGPAPGDFEDIDESGWRSAIDLTLMSVIRTTRKVTPIMKRNRWGCILNVTSVSVKQPLPGMVLSNTLRPAIAGLSKSLALELAPYGIRVHCLMPGSFLTDRNLTLGRRVAQERGVSMDQLISEWSANVPLRRMGEPLEFGYMVAFFASERCTFTTGTCVAVDGGQIKSVF